MVDLEGEVVEKFVMEVMVGVVEMCRGDKPNKSTASGATLRSGLGGKALPWGGGRQ